MEKPFHFNRILVMAPHTDDGEIGAGGLLNSFASSATSIHYLAFSSCFESLPEDFPKDTLIKECIAATNRIGIPQENVSIADYPVRRFSEWRQDILEKMIAIKKEYNPDCILLPCSNDVHQDHNTIHKEGIRAFKDRTILGYELPWNCFSFSPSLFFQLSDDAIRAKQEAIQYYESQAFRDYGDGRSLVKLSELRGSQIGVSYAEAFEVIRWIWKKQ